MFGWLQLRAVDENKIMHVYRKGGKHLVLFDVVDVNTQNEREMNGQKVVMPFIVRAANKKTFREIHQEIRVAQEAEQLEQPEGLERYSGFAHKVPFAHKVRSLHIM